MHNSTMPVVSNSFLNCQYSFYNQGRTRVQFPPPPPMDDFKYFLDHLQELVQEMVQSLKEVKCFIFSKEIVTSISESKSLKTFRHSLWFFAIQVYLNKVQLNGIAFQNA